MTATTAQRAFGRLRTLFVRAGLVRVRGCRLILRQRHFLKHPALRDLAWYDPPTHTVNLLRKALNLPNANVAGLLSHELGHAADVSLASRGAEGRADWLAGRATGRSVRYDTHALQTWGKGTARPKRLGT